LLQGVQRVDSDEGLKLILTDVGFMVIPRTGIETMQRGPLMGEETFIREIMGTITNCYSAGWFSLPLIYLANRLLGKRLMNTLPIANLNPHGVNHRAWIDIDTLTEFGNHFGAALQAESNKTPQAVREDFLRRVLSSFVSTDHGLAKNSFDQEHLQKTLAESPALNRILEGRLSEEGVQHLTRLLEPASEMGQGVYPLESRVHQVLKQEGRVFASPDEKRLALNRKRIELGEALQKKAEKSDDGKRFLEGLLDVAKAHGLSDNVHFRPSQTWKDYPRGFLATWTQAKINPEGYSVRNKRLADALGQLKIFLEQFGDRVLSDPEQGNPLQAFDKISKEEVGRALLDNAHGLLPHVTRARWGLSVLPVLVNVAVSMSVAFLNNWRTQQKSGGKAYFPGRGASPSSQPGMTRYGTVPPLYAAVPPYPGIPPAAGPSRPVVLPARQPPPRFGAGFALPKPNTFLAWHDFEHVGVTTVKQTFLFFHAIVLSRILAGLDRSRKEAQESPDQPLSWAEPREHALRDLTGGVLWFFGINTAQNIALKLWNPNKIFGDKPWHQRFHLGDLIRSELPSIQQLDDRLKQGLALLKTAQEKGRLTPERHQEELIRLTERFNKLKNFRNLSTGIGWMFSFLSVGVGIIMLNIWLTRRSDERRRQREQTLSLLSPPAVNPYTQPYASPSYPYY
jgi:hypothetical protein